MAISHGAWPSSLASPRLRRRLWLAWRPKTGKLLLEPSLIGLPSFEAARAIATQFVTDVRVGNVKNNDPSLIEPIELTVA
jgi:hypothetical protein